MERSAWPEAARAVSPRARAVALSHRRGDGALLCMHFFDHESTKHERRVATPPQMDTRSGHSGLVPGWLVE